MNWPEPVNWPESLRHIRGGLGRVQDTLALLAVVLLGLGFYRYSKLRGTDPRRARLSFIVGALLAAIAVIAPIAWLSLDPLLPFVGFGVLYVAIYEGCRRLLVLVTRLPRWGSAAIRLALTVLLFWVYMWLSDLVRGSIFTMVPLAFLAAFLVLLDFKGRFAEPLWRL